MIYEKESYTDRDRVGSGFASRVHYDALQRVTNTNIEVTGVFSKSSEKLRDYAEKRKLKLYNCLASDVIATIYTGYVSLERKRTEVEIINL